MTAFAPVEGRRSGAGEVTGDCFRCPAGQRLPYAAGRGGYRSSQTENLSLSSMMA